MSKDVDPTFFPNVRDILAVLPIGSTGAEKSFSCLRQIHTWLRTTMKDDRLGNLGILAMEGFSLPLNVDEICREFVTKHNRKNVLYD